MHRERLERLAEYLRSILEDRFDMAANGPYYATGTYMGEAGSLPGLAVQLFGNAADYQKAYSCHTYARELLGLTHAQAGELFLCYGWSLILSEVTKEQAIGAVEYLAQTGLVAWPGALQRGAA